MQGVDVILNYGVAYIAQGLTDDGKYLVSGSNEDAIVVWNLKKGTEVKILRGHTNIVESLNFSKDGNYLVSGSDDGTCLLWKWQ